MNIRPYILHVVVATAIALGAVFAGRSTAPARITEAPARVVRVVQAPARVVQSPVPAELVSMAKTLPGGMAELIALMKTLVATLAPNSTLGRHVIADKRRAEVCPATVTRGRYSYNAHFWYVISPSGKDLAPNAGQLTSRAVADRYLAALKKQAGC